MASVGTPRRRRTAAAWAQRFAGAALLLAATSLVASVRLLVLHQPEQTLAERWVTPVPYRGLAPEPPGGFLPPPRGVDADRAGAAAVYHVTREFGPAALGGLGSVVTMIAQAQTARGVDTRVVMPYYSYLAQYQPRRLRSVTIEYRPSARGETVRVVAEVHAMVYRGVNVYLVGAGHSFPLSVAFNAVDRWNIYTESRSLSWELRDLLFCALVAQLLADLDVDGGPPVVVHLHGATNAVVAPIFRDTVRREQRRPRTAFVYTLHDYDEETTYNVRVDHLQRLAVFPFTVEPAPHTVLAGRAYLSHFGISQADVVTCVSEVLAADIVEGRQQITNLALVIDALQAKARARRFVGIPNGVDLVSHSPFNNSVLDQAGLRFDPRFSILDRKAAAKRTLCDAGVTGSDACDRPLILFVGRFQLNKGIDICEVAAQLLRAHDVTFVVLGMYTTKDADVYLRLLRQHGAIIIQDTAMQEAYGPILRAAADIMFVPSKTEAFGLVAAEGMAFGAVIVTTGVGGLRDFLRGRMRGAVQRERHEVTEPNTHNAYVFHRSSRRELDQALRSALAFLAGLNERDHEAYVRVLIQQAHELRWDRPGGPLDRYDQVYRLARSVVV